MTRIKPTHIAALALIACFVTGGAGFARAAMDGIPFAGFRGLSNSVVSFHQFLDGPGHKDTPTRFYSSFTNDDTPSGALHTDTTRSFAGAMGLQVGSWRMEGSTFTRSTSFRSASGNGESTSQLGLVNLSYDFDTGGDGTVTPYISAGAGIASHTMAHGGSSGLGFDADHEAVTPVWSIGGGLNLRLNDNLSLNGGYNFLNGAESAGDGYAVDMSDHSMRVGVTYKIPADRAIKAPAAHDRAPPPPFYGE